MQTQTVDTSAIYSALINSLLEKTQTEGLKRATGEFNWEHDSCCYVGSPVDGELNLIVQLHSDDLAKWNSKESRGITIDSDSIITIDSDSIITSQLNEPTGWMTYLVKLEYTTGDQGWTQADTLTENWIRFISTIIIVGGCEEIKPVNVNSSTEYRNFIRDYTIDSDVSVGWFHNQKCAPGNRKAFFKQITGVLSGQTKQVNFILKDDVTGEAEKTHYESLERQDKKFKEVMDEDAKLLNNHWTVFIKRITHLQNTLAKLKVPADAKTLGKFLGGSTVGAFAIFNVMHRISAEMYSTKELTTLLEVLGWEAESMYLINKRIKALVKSYWKTQDKSHEVRSVINDAMSKAHPRFSIPIKKPKTHNSEFPVKTSFNQPPTDVQQAESLMGFLERIGSETKA